MSKGHTGDIQIYTSGNPAPWKDFIKEYKMMINSDSYKMLGWKSGTIIPFSVKRKYNDGRVEYGIEIGYHGWVFVPEIDLCLI